MTKQSVLNMPKNPSIILLSSVWIYHPYRVKLNERCPEKQKSRSELILNGSILVLRREGDSNPRYPFGVYSLSRRASSTTPASLREMAAQFTNYFLTGNPLALSSAAYPVPLPHTVLCPPVPTASRLPRTAYRSRHLPCHRPLQVFFNFLP